MIFNFFRKSKNKLANEINLMTENTKAANESLYNIGRQTKELARSLRDFNEIIEEFIQLFQEINKTQKEKCYNNNTKRTN
jgi:gas vesicle protein